MQRSAAGFLSVYSFELSENSQLYSFAQLVFKKEE